MTYQPNRMTNAELDDLVLRQDNPRRTFRRTSTTDLMGMSFPPLQWVVPGYVSAGFVVLAGRQKLGKTWLAIDMALGVATGGVAIGSIDCDQGDVLYIDMENGLRRIQSRINVLFADERDRPDLSRLEWMTDAPDIGSGLIEELERWRLSVENPRFVVVDVLQRVKPAGNATRNAYENDYSIWAPLQKWATRHGIAVLGLHHTKKGGADDPLEALSGSNGLSACADTTIVLDSDQNGKTLYVRGRDVGEKETALLFNGGMWTVLGEASDVRRSSERSQIIAALTDHGGPMAPNELAIATGKKSDNVRQLLFKMAKAKEVYKAGGGRYWLEPQHPDNTDNTDNADDQPIERNHEFGNGVPLSVTEADNASNRHKCWLCRERGDVLLVHYGNTTARLHRECTDSWKAEYDERQV